MQIEDLPNPCIAVSRSEPTVLFPWFWLRILPQESGFSNQSGGARGGSDKALTQQENSRNLQLEG
jgi:hypothetical protein